MSKIGLMGCIAVTQLLVNTSMVLGKDVYPNESKYYKIVDRHSGMVIDVSGWSKKDGGNIHKWSYVGGNNQQWKFQHLGGGWHKIISRHSGMVIDVSSWSKSDGANIQQWSWGGGQNQQWKLEDVGNGYVKIMARHSDKALSTKNRNYSNGDNIHQWTYKSAANQQWKLTEVGTIEVSNSNSDAKWHWDGKTIVVESGTFDGKNENFGGQHGDGEQGENQPAVFVLRKGANLKNCKIVPPAGDGIHARGDNIIDNVHFSDVGEDAISMRSNFEGGKLVIKNCSFKKAKDKVIQINRSCDLWIYNITVDDVGKIIRQDGGSKFSMTVHIDGINATNVRLAVFQSDSPNTKCWYKNVTCNLPDKQSSKEKNQWVGSFQLYKW
jgi:pectate lyase C